MAFAQHIIDMFSMIDAGDYDRLGLFFDDLILYQRPGYDDIDGLPALDDFYRNVRVIASGRHNVTQILVQSDVAVAEGVFDGVLKDGTQVSERFADFYRFANDRITERRTYFFRAAI
jgi:uncharacterized protein